MPHLRCLDSKYASDCKPLFDITYLKAIKCKNSEHWIEQILYDTDFQK